MCLLFHFIFLEIHVFVLLKVVESESRPSFPLDRGEALRGEKGLPGNRHSGPRPTIRLGREPQGA